MYPAIVSDVLKFRSLVIALTPLFVVIALAYFDGDSVGVGEPHAAPARYEVVEVERPEADRHVVADAGHECVHVVGLEGQVAGDTTAVRPVADGQPAVDQLR